jgi:miniconductance mechanosensitive channel
LHFWRQIRLCQLRAKLPVSAVDAAPHLFYGAVMENFKTIYVETLETLEKSPDLYMMVALAGLLFVAVAANFVVKRVLLRLLVRGVGLTKLGRDKELLNHSVLRRLANIVPAIIILNGLPLIPNMPEWLQAALHNVAAAFVILVVALSVNAALNAANLLYSRKPKAALRPIKFYIQILQIAVSIIAVILMIATLIDKSPLILLSGLGAMAAVLMLVFQDTLLSLVASVQISSSDMVRIGDWIEMPQLNADGDVIDIALHTVKVQNWDKTITTLPTRRLISEPFKNWRGMQESGGRRIKRALYIDQNSIHFLTAEEKAHLQRFRLLRNYMAEKEQEISAWNAELVQQGEEPMNMRRPTNIGTFRAYVQIYLRNHPGVNQNMTLLVRQLSPGSDGLPLEIYAFTNNTQWAVYEGIQSDIFDHLYAIMPEFGLNAFQAPSGRDFQILQPIKP